MTVAVKAASHFGTAYVAAAAEACSRLAGVCRSLRVMNSKRLRLIGYIHEFSREGTPFPYRPLHTIAPPLHDDAIGQLRLPLTAYQTFRETHRFS